MQKRKRIFKSISILICSVLILGMTSAYAREACEDGYVSINGRTEKEKQGNFVTVAVVDGDYDLTQSDSWQKLSGDKIVYYGEYELGADLNYEFNFYLGDYTKNGIYTVYIASKTEEIKKNEVYYINKQAYEEAVEELKLKIKEGEKSTADYIKSTDILKKLGLLCEFEGDELNQKAADFSAKLLLGENIDEYKNDEIRICVEKAVTAALLNSDNGLPQKYANLSFMGNGFYRYFNEKAINYFDKTKVGSIKTFDGEMLNAIALYCVNDSKDSVVLKSLLSDNNYTIGIKVISDGACNAAVRREKAFSSLSELVEFINNYKETSGGNSGGGGGGVSSGGHAYSGTTLETEDKKNDTIDEVSVFSDIDNVPWAKEAINALYSLGVINGKEIGKFYPNDMITREEFVKMLVSAFSMKLIDEDVKFDDVSENDWSYDFIKTAYIAGITKGVGGNMFGKTDNILRQDICVMINRLFDISKIDISAKQNVKIFVDADDISDYAIDAVNNMSAANIINGDESGNVNPMAYATRAEVAKLLFRAREVYNSKR